MPLAHHWYDANTKIDGYDVVASSKDGNLNPADLRPGDVISDGHHMGFYAPEVHVASGESVPAAYSRREVFAYDNVAQGAQQILAKSVSAASINSGHGNPLLGGPVWIGWGVRPGQAGPLVVRRMRSRPFDRIAQNMNIMYGIPKGEQGGASFGRQGEALRRLAAGVAAPTLPLVLWLGTAWLFPDPHPDVEPWFPPIRRELWNALAVEVSLYYLVSFAIGLPVGFLVSRLWGRNAFAFVLPTIGMAHLLECLVWGWQFFASDYVVQMLPPFSAFAYALMAGMPSLRWEPMPKPPKRAPGALADRV